MNRDSYESVSMKGTHLRWPEPNDENGDQNDLDFRRLVKYELKHMNSMRKKSVSAHPNCNDRCLLRPQPGYRKITTVSWSHPNYCHFVAVFHFYLLLDSKFSYLLRRRINCPPLNWPFSTTQSTLSFQAGLISFGIGIVYQPYSTLGWMEIALSTKKRFDMWIWYSCTIKYFQNIEKVHCGCLHPLLPTFIYRFSCAIMPIHSLIISISMKNHCDFQIMTYI